jgi:hypothetical protein
MLIDQGLYWMLGLLPGNVRTSLSGASSAELEAAAIRLKLQWWSIYRNGPHFNSTTQSEYLVCHHQDPYWLAKGVLSEA